MWKEILIATGNAGKLHDIREIFDDLPAKFLGLKDLNLDSEVEETGETYEANALLKARHFHNLTDGQFPIIADDSGVVVEALKGELGVKTRRWGAGQHASDQEWIDHFMKVLATHDDRRAKFVNASVFYQSDHQYEVFFGEVSGVIAPEIMAPLQPGLPMSSLFIPDGYDTVLGALPIEEKHRVSHRGLAMSKIKQYLSQKLAQK